MSSRLESVRPFPTLVFLICLFLNCGYSSGSSSLAPSITTQPSAQTVTAGQTTKFTVAASGTAPLSYRWQKGSNNISGAISPSYSTPATTMSDNGSTFRVVVSNAAGTMTSNAAVLNVTAGFFGSVHHYPALQPRRNRGTEGDLCRGRIGHGSAQLSVEERDYQHLGRNLPSYTTPVQPRPFLSFANLPTRPRQS